MSERSEKPAELWESSFVCDGNCGAEIALWVSGQDTVERDMLAALKALGWLFLGEDEGYCPNCQKTADRINAKRRGKIPDIKKKSAKPKAR
jgi:hypothetical protein